MNKRKPRNSINTDYAENKRIKAIRLQSGIFLFNLSLKESMEEENRDGKVLQKDLEMFCEGIAAKHISYVYGCVSYV